MMSNTKQFKKNDTFSGSRLITTNCLYFNYLCHLRFSFLAPFVSYWGRPRSFRWRNKCPRRRSAETRE